jgi:hypothetical protein
MTPDREMREIAIELHAAGLTWSEVAAEFDARGFTWMASWLAPLAEGESGAGNRLLKNMAASVDQFLRESAAEREG